MENLIKVSVMASDRQQLSEPIKTLLKCRSWLAITLTCWNLNTTKRPIMANDYQHLLEAIQA